MRKALDAYMHTLQIKASYPLNVQSGIPTTVVMTRFETCGVRADIKDFWLICLFIFEICLYVEVFNDYFHLRYFFVFHGFSLSLSLSIYIYIYICIYVFKTEKRTQFYVKFRFTAFSNNKLFLGVLHGKFYRRMEVI